MTNIIPHYKRGLWTAVHIDTGFSVTAQKRDDAIAQCRARVEADLPPFAEILRYDKGADQFSVRHCTFPRLIGRGHTRDTAIADLIEKARLAGIH